MRGIRGGKLNGRADVLSPIESLPGLVSCFGVADIELARERKGSSVLQIAFDCDLLLGIRRAAGPADFVRPRSRSAGVLDRQLGSLRRHVKNSLESSVGQRPRHIRHVALLMCADSAGTNADEPRSHVPSGWTSRLQIGELAGVRSQSFNKVADFLTRSARPQALKPASGGDDLRSTDHDSEVRACGFIAF